MAKTRVPLHGKPQGFVVVESDATVGATIGTNLYRADGTLVTEADLTPAEDVTNTTTGAGTPTTTDAVSEGATNLYFSNERAQDALAAAFAAGTRTGITVTYNDGSNSFDFTVPPASVAWGAITGTLSAQTDLQAALDAKLDDSQLDTDTTLAANSDSKIASQKAVKAYIDASIAGLLDLKGGTACAANPNYPAALKGDAYYVTSAGKIGGASGKSVDVGDVFVANADNTGGTEASVGASWFVLEHNLVGALIATNNLSDLTNVITARSNLGLGAVALLASIATSYIDNAAVTYAKMQNVSAASRLLGSSDTGAGAAPTEIILGANLNMSGSTLSATGAGGGAPVDSGLALQLFELPIFL